MKISFVVIAYNEERNVEKTITAIQQQANMGKHEIIIVNDGSKDKTLEVTKRLSKSDRNIIIVNLQPNQGRGAARVAGLSRASGDYIAFVDADITLPNNWLSKCLPYLGEFDACGGTAVPDGDVAYIHGLLNLKPKAAPHTTAVTGSNGLYRRDVFEKIHFDANRKNGEDVDLGYKFSNAGLKTITVPGLFVEHRETKSYKESVKWLFESGIGATRQFYEHRAIRMPDMAFAGFTLVTIFSIVFSIFLPNFLLAALLLIFTFLTLTSIMHLRGKFELADKPLSSFLAIFINDSLLFSYYSGRFIGLFTEIKWL